jgi:hypothetical protein
MNATAQVIAPDGALVGDGLELDGFIAVIRNRAAAASFLQQ